MTVSFFAEVRQKVEKEGLRAVVFANCCLGHLFLQEDPSRKNLIRAGIHKCSFSHAMSARDQSNANGHVEWKLLQPVLCALADKSLDASSTVCQMAVRGLGNLASEALEKLRKHKKAILEVLMRAIKDVTSSEIVGDSLTIAEDLGSAFGWPGDVCFGVLGSNLMAGVSWLQDETVLRSSAFTLYGVLASSAKRKWRSFLSKEITTSTWTRIMLHLQDPDPEVYNVRASFHFFLHKEDNLNLFQQHFLLEVQDSLRSFHSGQVSNLPPSLC
uniref:Maestro/Maestro-like HEAT-repeats domain-containing protein n=1 Tax=Apteryx owenii TaxID=8824 RepID=A0A8B9SBX1_APTOW